MSVSITCTCPGKVLLTGGYLILEQPNTGAVVSVNARFFTTISILDKKINNTRDKINVQVHSPQFEHVTDYELKWNKIENEELDGVTSGYYEISPRGENTYVEAALEFGFNTLRVYCKEENDEKNKYWETFNDRVKNGLKIEVKGDNAFYSQQENLTKRKLIRRSSSLGKLPRFVKCQSSKLKKLHKTGLGSSAALISSFTSTLYCFLTLDERRREEIKEKQLEEIHNSNVLEFLHNLSQFIHCLAQGKVGSGFDVSSAIYGTQLYSRFNVDCIKSRLAECSSFFNFNLEKYARGSRINVKASNNNNDGNNDSSTTMIKPVNAHMLYSLLYLERNNWDNLHVPLIIPKGIGLALGDVNAGSNTPSMVRSVLNFKQSNPNESSQLWTTISLYNNEINRLLHFLNTLSIQYPEKYEETIQICSYLPSSEWIGAEHTSYRITNVLHQISESFKKVRKHLKILGDKCNVPIEPDEQTRLLDATQNLPGVLFTGVPGAGGFDAIFAICLERKDWSAVEQVEEFWLSWKEMTVLPQLLTEDSLGIEIEKFSLNDDNDNSDDSSSHIIQDNITIRYATSTDTDIIAQFNKNMAIETENYELSDELISQGVSNLINNDSLGFYLLAVDPNSNKVVGQLSITYEWSDWRNGVMWWIQSVYVLPDYRKKKVFRKLYDFIYQKATNNNNQEEEEKTIYNNNIVGIRLYVDHNNLNAQKVYEAIGLQSSHYIFYEIDFINNNDNNQSNNNNEQ